MNILVKKAEPENLDAVLSLYPHLFSSDDINFLHFFKKLNPSTGSGQAGKNRKKMLEEGRGSLRQAQARLGRRSMENLQLLEVIT